MVRLSNSRHAVAALKDKADARTNKPGSFRGHFFRFLTGITAGKTKNRKRRESQTAFHAALSAPIAGGTFGSEGGVFKGANPRLPLEV